MGLQPTNDRLGERIPLGAQLPARQLGQRPRIGFAFEQPLQDRAGREATHIGDHCGELDIGGLQHRLPPVGESCPLAGEVNAVARQIAQVALGGGGDAAGAHEPMAQQVCQPLGVLHIGRAARDRLDVIGVDHHHLALLLQQIEHWPPVRAG
jgi:hypothetical protein